MRITELKFQSNGLLRILVTCLLAITFGAATGWAITQGVVIKSLFVGVVALLALFLLLQARSVKGFVLQRFLLYLTIATGFIGSAFLTTKVGPIHLFPYRVFLSLLWVILAMQIAVNQGKVALSHIKVKPYLQFLGLWLIYAVLSSAWALSKADAIRYVTFLFMAVSIIFFIVYYFSNLKDLKGFYFLWLLVLGIQMVIGTWEATTGLHLPMSKYFGETKAVFEFRPTGTFGGPNSFGSFLSFGVFFILAFFRHMNKGIFKKILVGAILALSMYLIIMTRSRGNYLAVLLSLSFLIIFMLKIRQTFKVAIVVGLSLLLLILIFPQQTHRVWSTAATEFESLFNPIEPGQGSIGIRLVLADNSVESLIRSLGFGVGAGNAGYPHNWWLEILASYGIWIFVGYVLFYNTLVLKLYKIYKRLIDESERMICEGLLLALIAFFFVGFSPSSIMAFKPQWFLFAFALAFLNYYRLSRGGYS